MNAKSHAPHAEQVADPCASPVAVVDVGSNSIKLMIARRDPDGRIVALAHATETVRLGLGVAATGRLAPDRVEPARAVLTRFADEARRCGATVLRGVATEAVRVAANGGEFVARMRTETGWDLRIIGGDEEASLSWRGLAALVDLAGRVVVADVGGGSTEVTVADEGVRRFARSVPLGSGALTERFVQADPPTATEIAACRGEALAILTPLGLPADASPRLLATGGTGEYLARLVPRATALDARAIDDVLTALEHERAAALAAAVGIAEARARVLPAGIAIVAAIVALVRPAAIEVAPSGLRMGEFLAVCGALG